MESIIYSKIAFDIETAPSEEAQEFIAQSEIKRLKDPEKIAEKRKEMLEDAALSPLTGKILLIGLQYARKPIILEGHEFDIINEFWLTVARLSKSLVGWNSESFDLPFIIRRSWKHGIQIPTWATTMPGRKSMCIDLMKEFECGVYGAKRSLYDAQRFFGLPAKDSEKSRNFAAFYAEHPEEARAHCAGDVESVIEIGKRMGVIASMKTERIGIDDKIEREISAKGSDSPTPSNNEEFCIMRVADFIGTSKSRAYGLVRKERNAAKMGDATYPFERIDQVIKDLDDKSLTDDPGFRTACFLSALRDDVKIWRIKLAGNEK